MEWAGFVLALVSVLSSAILGFFGLRYSHKNRISSQADVLYRKRLDAYSDLCPTLTEFTGVCTAFFHDKGRELEGSLLEEFKHHTQGGYKAVNAAYRRWSFILPVDVNLKIVSFLNAYTVLIKRPDSYIIDEAGKRVETYDPEHVLAEALFDAYNAVRKDLMVESLSRQTSELIAKVAGDHESLITWDTRKPPAPPH